MQSDQAVSAPADICTPTDASERALSVPAAQSPRSSTTLLTQQELAALDPAALDVALADLRQAFSAARDDYAARPRRQVVALSAVPPGALGDYLAAWRLQVRAAANRSFVPVAADCGRAAALRLLVALRADGSAENVRLLASSGLRELDDAALATVQREAPYVVFPAALQAEADVVEVIATWRYTPAAGLQL